MSESQQQKLEKLKAKREALTARIQNEEHRLNAKKRKQDTRRKILVGSYILDTLEKQGSVPALTSDSLNTHLDKFLTRKYDRVLFNLSIPEEVTE